MALTRGGFRHYDYGRIVVLLTMTNAATEVAYPETQTAPRPDERRCSYIGGGQCLDGGQPKELP
jgi:hypothetical protein